MYFFLGEISQHAMLGLEAQPSSGGGSGAAVTPLSCGIAVSGFGVFSAK